MQELNIETIYKKRKTVSIKVTHDCKVVVTAPLQWTEHDVAKLIEKKRSWIDKTISAIEKRNANKITIPDGHILYLGSLYHYERVTGISSYYIVDSDKLVIKSSKDLTKKEELSKFYKTQAKFLIPSMVYKQATKHGINITDVRVSSARKRYGSYSTSGVVMIATRMIVAPEYVINAVILHELAHSKVMNHSKKFYDVLYQLCPYYDEANKWLKFQRPLIEL